MTTQHSRAVNDSPAQSGATAEPPPPPRRRQLCSSLPASSALRTRCLPPVRCTQKYTRAPQELQYGNSDILLAADDPGRQEQQQLLQRVAADEADERDWRSRSALPPQQPAGAAQQQGGQQQGWREPGTSSGGAAAAASAAPSSAAAPAAASAAPGGGASENAKIQKATDIGRTAWHAGTEVEGVDQTLRKVKGILNKLTPEKFERLLGQMIPMVNSYEVLRGTISQVCGSSSSGGWLWGTGASARRAERYMVEEEGGVCVGGGGGGGGSGKSAASAVQVSHSLVPWRVCKLPRGAPCCALHACRCLRTLWRSPRLLPCTPTCAASWTPRCQSSTSRVGAPSSRGSWALRRYGQRGLLPGTRAATPVNAGGGHSASAALRTRVACTQQPLPRLPACRSTRRGQAHQLPQDACQHLPGGV